MKYLLVLFVLLLLFKQSKPINVGFLRKNNFEKIILVNPIQTGLLGLLGTLGLPPLTSVLVIQSL